MAVGRYRSFRGLVELDTLVALGMLSIHMCQDAAGTTYPGN